MLSSLLCLLFVGLQTKKSDAEVAPFALGSAILIFCYMFLDNTDGKQARRTNTSSPLGELIDHDCDSLTVGVCKLCTSILHVHPVLDKCTPCCLLYHVVVARRLMHVEGRGS
jgi:phosphatidylglycerophosphate synthase